jgi:hypothetical protein
MTQAMTVANRPLFFPASLDTNEAGVILPRSRDELAPLVDTIAHNQLLPLVRKLVNGTNKRKREVRWSAVNRERLELMRLCVDRLIAEQGQWLSQP